MKRIYFIIFFFVTLLTPFCNIHALNQDTKARITAQSEVMAKQTFSEASASTIIGNAIEVFLSLLAIIFIVLLLIAGYQYMTAQGDSTKASNAFKSIRTAVIGLIIILMAYTITYFVFNSLEEINEPSYNYNY